MSSLLETAKNLEQTKKDMRVRSTVDDRDLLFRGVTEMVDERLGIRSGHIIEKRDVVRKIGFL